MFWFEFFFFILCCLPSISKREYYESWINLESKKRRLAPGLVHALVLSCLTPVDTGICDLLAILPEMFPNSKACGGLQYTLPVHTVLFFYGPDHEFLEKENPNYFAHCWMLTLAKYLAHNGN